MKEKKSKIWEVKFILKKAILKLQLDQDYESDVNLHFKLLALRVSLISSVANPNSMSALRVWWLQTRKITLLTGVTMLEESKNIKYRSQSTSLMIKNKIN